MHHGFCQVLFTKRRACNLLKLRTYLHSGQSTENVNHTILRAQLEHIPSPEFIASLDVLLCLTKPRPQNPRPMLSAGGFLVLSNTQRYGNKMLINALEAPCFCGIQPGRILCAWMGGLWVHDSDIFISFNLSCVVFHSIGTKSIFEQGLRTTQASCW